MPSRPLGILGTGLIGASIGLRSRAEGRRVLGWDPDDDAVRIALARGALDEGVTRARVLAECETVVVAAPPSATRAALESLRGGDASWSLLLDVASVKASIAKAGRGVTNFVPTHPLAGNEGSGPGAAEAALFEGRTWAYVPSGDEALDARARAFIESAGAQPFACDAARHDRIVAVTSHLPQLVDWRLAELIRAVDPEFERLCGPAAREILRLAGSPRALWREIVEENEANVGDALAKLVRALRAEEGSQGDGGPAGGAR